MHFAKVAIAWSQWPVLERAAGFRTFLAEGFDEVISYAALRRAETIGCPVGSGERLADMERLTGLALLRGWRPKPEDYWGHRNAKKFNRYFGPY